MSEKTKSEAIREELTKEQLEKVTGGFNPVDGVVQPIKPPVVDFNPVDGNTLP
jgi:bacteriocin-like protein